MSAKPVDTLKKLNKYDAIEVVWLDSSELDGWQDKETEQNHDDLIVHSVTKYLSHDNIMLNTVRCVAASQHGGFLTIPMCSIQSIKKLS